MDYNHTQKFPMTVLVLGIGILLLILVFFIPETSIKVAVTIGGIVMLLLALSFHQLKVMDAGDRLTITFGPIPLARKSIDYSEIVKVERSRTTVLDGWGIHPSLSGGWNWNIWGFDCVDTYLTRGRKVRIGTDDVERLESFLKQRIGTD